MAAPRAGFVERAGVGCASAFSTGSSTNGPRAALAQLAGDETGHR